MSLRTRLTLILLAAALPLVAGWWWVGQQAARASLDERLEEFVSVHMNAGGREAFERNPEAFAVSLGPPPAKPPTRNDNDPNDGVRPEDSPPRRADDRPRRGPGGRAGRPGGRDPLDRLLDDLERDGARSNRRQRRRRGDGSYDPTRRTDLWIYGPDFTSKNPNAPKLPDALRNGVSAESARIATDWSSSEGGEGRRVLVTLWPDTDCAYGLAQRPFPPERAESARLLIWGAVALAAGLLLAMLLAFGPILRRIRRLTHGVEEAANTQYDTEVDAQGSDELAELGRAFNAAGKRVRTQMDTVSAREQTLRAFVANTTHDVMVPLTVLQGHLVALRKAVKESDPDQIKLVTSGLEEAHYIGCLVSNLSTVAKLEANEVHLDENNLDLVELSKRAVARHEPLGRERGIIIDTVLPPEPVVTTGDVTLLEQAVSNVINNAVRYNRDGGRVIVVLEARKGLHHFCLRVFDDGPGVTEEELARITDRSFRGESARSRRPNGGGLGLHIARDVVERHGWTLTVGPAVSGGLEVVFEGPLATQSP